MPPLLKPGERQLATEDANEARVVTKNRWVVESRNGHIKSKFKYLNLTQQIHVLPHVGDFYRFVGAIINRFHGLITMRNADATLALDMQQTALVPNHVQARVAAENLLYRNVHRWFRLDAGQLDDFPILTIDFLKELTYGVYQVDLASAYIQDTCHREDDDELQVEVLNVEGQHFRLPEAGFIRARIWSRFRNQTRYQIFVEYVPHGNVADEPVTGYYCTYRTGARTLGTCAHVTSLLWYLGYAIHDHNVRYPLQVLLHSIDDAGNRPPQVNPD